MSQEPVDHHAPTPADELRRAQQKRQQRTLITFALAEGFLLAVAVIVIYVLELIDPEMGVWVIVGIALLGGGLLGASLMASIRRNQREIAELSQR